MLVALGWGLLAASSLIIGAPFGILRNWNQRFVGLVLGFGAGALVASISFELAQQGFRVGGAIPVALGLAPGALLDGVPEQAVLGIGTATGPGVSLALLVAIFVSNLPEANRFGQRHENCRASEKDDPGALDSRGGALRPASVGGFQLQELAGKELQGGINGFAAGALLVMLVGSMIPEASEKAKDQAGLAAVLGFAVVAGLSLASQPFRS